MPTVIRFSRHGAKKRPFYWIVAADSRRPRDGKFLDKIGTYNPTVSENSVMVSKPKLEYWLSVGAQMSLSVKQRLKEVLKELSNHKE